MMGLPAGTRIWIAAGFTDMRSGFNGLAAKVETALQEDPYSGHVFVFRGRQWQDTHGAPVDLCTRRPRQRRHRASRRVVCLLT
jgi:transposase